MASDDHEYADDSLPLTARLLSVERGTDDMSISVAFELIDATENVIVTHSVKIGGNLPRDEDLLALARHFLAVDLTRAAEATKEWLLDKETKQRLQSYSSIS